VQWPVQAAVRAAGYLSKEEDEDEGSSVEEEVDEEAEVDEDGEEDGLYGNAPKDSKPSSYSRPVPMKMRPNGYLVRRSFFHELGIFQWLIIFIPFSLTRKDMMMTTPWVAIGMSISRLRLIKYAHVLPPPP
jgi:hypothetical protein